VADSTGGVTIDGQPARAKTNIVVGANRAAAFGRLNQLLLAALPVSGDRMSCIGGNGGSTAAARLSNRFLPSTILLAPHAAPVCGGRSWSRVDHVGFPPRHTT